MNYGWPGPDRRVLLPFDQETFGISERTSLGIPLQGTNHGLNLFVWNQGCTDRGRC